MKLAIYSNTLKAISLSFLLISPTTYAAQDELKLVSVKLAKQEQVTPVVWLTGNIASRLNVRLSAERNGRLLWIKDIGDQVKKGEALAQLDTLQNEFRLAEQQSQLRQQKSNTEYLRKQLKRQKALINNKSTARIELDRTERDLSVAEEALNSLNIQISRTQLVIDRSTIRAPFDGQVNQRMAQLGEYITVGSPLVQFVDPNTLDIRIAAPLSVALFLNRGDNMVVKWNNQLQLLPVRTWSPAGTQSSRTFEVLLDASNLKLMSGSAVTVSLPKELANLTTMVPRDALVLRERETFVVTVDQDNAAHKVDVLVGRGVGDWISVSGKVTAGDKVVVRGGERLKDGQKVRFSETENTIVAIN
ncbi:MAG: efflux transporter periplasmic adaptor subunit [Kangiella sp.]|nr:MAG: efflux transporter periplasmic adaptor subunit [Kangiella sp.]